MLVETSGKVCFAQSAPVLQAPKKNKREARLFVTFRPSEKITDEKVRKMLGLADDSKIIDLMTYIVDGNSKKSIDAVEEIFDIGADPKLVLHSLLETCYLMTRTKILGKIINDLRKYGRASNTLFGKFLTLGKKYFFLGLTRKFNTIIGTYSFLGFLGKL